MIGWWEKINRQCYEHALTQAARFACAGEATRAMMLTRLLAEVKQMELPETQAEREQAVRVALGLVA